ncbi:hypothetical protein VE01_04306 [Pseudogymnoascus verrucosus]|uniref:MOZ protein represents a chromatin-associated acetyltransferase n=1 Tax=Pseudogymnoascus verrucosus TaxID=342668 RepID=A0A1B8GNQ2_9PEZI|nr:uncharacterized protein VE01_04306 [Pseudogymnoascus verrucosus]OBT97475.1 hypothetical protein VE01_04306 [Pseudogymnoascus verrucosus]
MSTMRLTFLYPHLFRAVRRAECPGPGAAVRQCAHSGRQRRAGFAGTAGGGAKFAERRGKGVEPIVEGEKEGREDKVEESSEGEGRVTSQAERAAENDTGDAIAEGGISAADAAREKGDATAAPTPVVEEKAEVETDKYRDNPVQTTDDAPDPNANRDTAPTDSVLHMDPPLESLIGSLPHLAPAPYVHHFDSYTLTQRIAEGGFTSTQSVETMKIVRALLTANLDMAKDGLVSKSDVENETYLFQAACSELRTEIQNARKASAEGMRLRRTMLQNEADILNQKMTQDLATLKDELKEMFNDRKMEVRMEHSNMESQIQELSYKITVALNSDTKSEVEGVRWILTRRAVLAIVFMAFVVLSSLRLASYRSQEAALALQKAERKEELQRQAAEKQREAGTQTEEAILAAEGVSTS